MQFPEIPAKAVVFDYGNTLMLSPFEDVLKLKKAEFQKELANRGYKFRGEEIICAWITADEEVNYIHISHFGQEEPIILEALKKLGIQSHLAELSRKFLEIYRRGYAELSRMNPRRIEIKEILEHLKNKGKKLGIFSDGRKFDLSLVLGIWEISEYFDFAIASEEIGFEKPHENVSKIIIQKTGLLAEDIAYVGDNPIRDGFSKEAGMKFILYFPPQEYRKSVPWRRYTANGGPKPDAIIGNLLDLKNIIT